MSEQQHDEDDFTLPELVDLALSSPEIGAVNFNILRILLHEMLRKGNAEGEVARLDDLQSHQIQNFRNYLQGAGTASPMPGVLRYSQNANVGNQSAPKTPRTGRGAAGEAGSSGPSQQGTENGGGSGGQKTARSARAGSMSARDKELESKVARLERHLEALYALPTNQQILGDSSEQTTQGMSVNDMWQIIQLNNRVAAAEAAIQKMASLIEDLAKEMKHVKTDASDVRRNSDSVAQASSQLNMKMEPITEKCVDACKAVDALKADLEKVKRQWKEELDRLQKATGVDVGRIPSFMKTNEQRQVPGDQPHQTTTATQQQPQRQMQNAQTQQQVKHGGQNQGTQQQQGYQQQPQGGPAQQQLQGQPPAPSGPYPPLPPGQTAQQQPQQQQQMQGQQQNRQPQQMQQGQGQFQHMPPGQFQQMEPTQQLQQMQPGQGQLQQTQPGQVQQMQPGQVQQMQPGQVQQMQPGQVQQMQPGQVQQMQPGQVQQMQPGQGQFQQPGKHVQQGQPGQFVQQQGQPGQFVQQQGQPGQKQGQPGQFAQQQGQPGQFVQQQGQPGQFVQQQGQPGQFVQQQGQPGQFVQQQGQFAQKQGQTGQSVQQQGQPGQFVPQGQPGQFVQQQGQPGQFVQQGQPGQLVQQQGQPGQFGQQQPGKYSQQQPRQSVQQPGQFQQQQPGGLPGTVVPSTIQQPTSPGGTQTGELQQIFPSVTPSVAGTQVDGAKPSPSQAVGIGSGGQPEPSVSRMGFTGASPSQITLGMEGQHYPDYSTMDILPSESQVGTRPGTQGAHKHAYPDQKANMSKAHPGHRHHGPGKPIPVDVTMSDFELGDEYAFQDYPEDQEKLAQEEGLGVGSDLVQKELQDQYAKLQSMQRQMAAEIQDKMEFIYQKLLREIAAQHLTTSPYMALGTGAETCLGPGVCTGHGMPAGTAVCEFPQAHPVKQDVPFQIGTGGGPAAGSCPGPGVCPGAQFCPSCKNDMLHHLKVPPMKGGLVGQQLNVEKDLRPAISTDLLKEVKSFILLPKDLEELRLQVKEKGKVPVVFDENEIIEKLATLWEAVNLMKGNEEAMAVRIIKQDAALKKVPPSVLAKLHKIPAENLEAIASATFDKPLVIPGSPSLNKDDLANLRGIESSAGLRSTNTKDNIGFDEVQTIFKNLSNLLVENAAMKDKLQQLADQLHHTDATVVTKQMLVDAMSDKADKGQMNTKVSYDEFGSSMEELNTRMQNLLLEVYQKNDNWKYITDHLAEEMSEKLDKNEIGPLRAYFRHHLQHLEEKVFNLTQQMEEPDPAGTRKKILKDYNCISCDRHVNISGVTNAPILPVLGPILAGHTTASQRAYELHKMRVTKSRYDPECRDINLMGRPQSQSQSQTAKTAGLPESMTQSDVMHLVNRYVGGSHTSVTTSERLASYKRMSTAKPSPNDNREDESNESPPKSNDYYYNDE